MNALTEHPSWRLLNEIFEARRRKHFEGLVHSLMHGREDIVQRKLDIDRAFFAGAKWILENPEQAQATFENALRRAGALNGDDA